MANMAAQTVSFLGFFLVLILVLESAVIDRDGSGAGEFPPDIPDLFAKDKNLRKVPPFGDPVLAGEEFDTFDLGVNNPDARPSDYDYKDPVENDYDADTDYTGKESEKIPEMDRGGHPHDENDGEEEDRNVHKNNDEIDKSSEVPEKHDEEEGDNEFPKKHDEDDEEIEESKKYDGEDEESGKDSKVDEEDIDHPVDEDLDKSFDAEEDIDKSLDEEQDRKVPDDEDIHKDIDSPIDSEEDADESKEDFPEEDFDESGDTGLFHGGFDTPFFNVRQVTKYFQQLEKAVEHVFRETMDEAVLLNGTYANTTEEEVEIDGKKYIVQKSIIKGKDENSSIYIEALSTMPATNKTEENKDSGI